MRWTCCWPFREDQSISRETASPQLLNPDQNGLKLLYTGPDPQVDIVAVHGLNGHREKSWTSSTGVNWLQDLLPADLPNTRVYTWGYNASSAGESDPDTDTSSLQKISEGLVSDLWEIRELTRTHSHPIIFIAHSLGGTIVKNALLYSDSAQEGPSMRVHSISLSTYGVFFMGTPELDSRLIGLQSYLASVKSDQETNNSYYKEASWLLAVLQRYSSISERFRTLFAYESLNKPAPQGLSAEVSPCIALDTDHAGLIRFDSPLDVGYLKIKEHLLDMTQDANQKD